jgi:SnoaL-like polyketide cyclase
VAGEWLARSFENGERLLRAGRQACDLTGPACDLALEVAGDPGSGSRQPRQRIGSRQETRQAEFMGVPATGRTINVGIADYFHISNGTLVQHWGVMDTGAMMQQLTAP